MTDEWTERHSSGKGGSHIVYYMRVDSDSGLIKTSTGSAFWDYTGIGDSVSLSFRTGKFTRCRSWRIERNTFHLENHKESP